MIAFKTSVMSVFIQGGCKKNGQKYFNHIIFRQNYEGNVWATGLVSWGNSRISITFKIFMLKNWNSENSLVFHVIQLSCKYWRSDFFRAGGDTGGALCFMSITFWLLCLSIVSQILNQFHNTLCSNKLPNVFFFFFSKKCSETVKKRKRFFYLFY